MLSLVLTAAYLLAALSGSSSPGVSLTAALVSIVMLGLSGICIRTARMLPLPIINIVTPLMPAKSRAISTTHTNTRSAGWPSAASTPYPSHSCGMAKLTITPSVLTAAGIPMVCSPTGLTISSANCVLSCCNCVGAAFFMLADTSLQYCRRRVKTLNIYILSV
ncbi:hypothetical protein DJ490_23910 [Enterobacter hormaechei]|nr:hypothetical protein DJ490_23910 [Enterobacter hormaechei]